MAFLGSIIKFFDDSPLAAACWGIVFLMLVLFCWAACKAVMAYKKARTIR